MNYALFKPRQKDARSIREKTEKDERETRRVRLRLRLRACTWSCVNVRKCSVEILCKKRILRLCVCVSVYLCTRYIKILRKLDAKEKESMHMLYKRETYTSATTNSYRYHFALAIACYLSGVRYQRESHSTRLSRPIPFTIELTQIGIP